MKTEAEVIFEHFGDITEDLQLQLDMQFAQEKFLDACRVVQNPVWAAPKEPSRLQTDCHLIVMRTRASSAVPLASGKSHSFGG